MQPFFTVVVPVYNVKQYLDACMETLLGQTFDDYEILLLNDGSTDGSAQMCDRYQREFPSRVRVIHQQNRGVTIGRSVLFREARGKYIVNVDSDDLIHFRALEIIHDYITRYDADVVIYRASGEPDFSEPLRELDFADGEVVSLSSSRRLRHLMLTGTLMCNLWNKAFRRELCQLDWNFEELSHVGEGEDLMYSVGILDKARRVVFSDSILYYYRMNPNSITNSYKPGLFRSLRDVTVLQRRYAVKWDPALGRQCDLDALQRYYKVLVRIAMSEFSDGDKRRYMKEVARDPEFLRIFPLTPELESLKERVILTLVKYNCFAPLYIYAAAKTACQEWEGLP